MTTTLASAPASIETLADLLDRLGGISPARIRMRPPPGTATENDVIEIEAREDRLFELVDGVLVEKGMGYRESLLAVFLAGVLGNWVRERNLGLVSGSDGMMRLFPGLVRIPDVAFVSWEKVPGGRVPTQPIPSLVPDLIIEVLSPSNTAAEMQRKRHEYFGQGVSVVWMVDPKTRTVSVYSNVDDHEELSEQQTLTAESVLPGFALPLNTLFAELDRAKG